MVDRLWGHAEPWDRGVPDPLETRYSPRVLIPNLVILGETVWA